MRFKNVLNKAVAGLCVHAPDKLSLLVFAPETTYDIPASFLIDQILSTTSGDRDWAAKMANVMFRSAYEGEDETTLAATGLALARLSQTPWLTVFIPHASQIHMANELPTVLYMSRAQFNKKVLVDWRIGANAETPCGDVLLTLNIGVSKAA